MIHLFIKKFVKNYDSTSLPEVRRGYGKICGIAGMILNAILFSGKLTVGLISGSIAVTADAFNNLSDAGSSVILLIGFKLSGKKPDSDHPFGHGRIEYVSALLVAVMILVMAAELITASIDRIVTPKTPDTSWITVAILVCSVLVKLYMALYNRKYGKLINSEAMTATAEDSRNDVIATLVVLVATVVSKYTTLQLDGICGLLVGVFVLISGIRTAFATISTILGKPPQKELTDSIEESVLSFDGILGVHDIVVHDYGPGRMMISLHAEVPATGNLLMLHSLIEKIEQHLEERFCCKAVIHMDPVKEDDETTRRIRNLVSGILYGISPELKMHDFRADDENGVVVSSFDVLVPYDFPLDDSEVKLRICSAVAMIEKCELTVNIDRG